MSSTRKLDVFTLLSEVSRVTFRPLFPIPMLFLLLCLRDDLSSGLCLRDDVKEVITPKGEVVTVASAVLLALLNPRRGSRRICQVGCHTEDASSFIALLLDSGPIGQPFLFWLC